MSASLAEAWVPTHSALEPRAGARLEKAQLTDKQRLGVVLQGAGLLSLLSRTDRYLPQSWEGTTIDDSGRLGGVVTAAGRVPSAPQRDLRRLLLRVFDEEQGVSGRGEARCAARRLAVRWDQMLFRRAPDRLVEEILTEAPWLWEERYAAAREGLLGRLTADASGLWIAGPGRFHRALLDSIDRPSTSLSWMMADEVHDSTPRTSGSESPDSLRRRGRWREAVLAWELRGAKSSEDRVAYAECLYAAGSFERARRVISRLRSPAARLLRLRCQWQLGQLTAIRRGLKELEAVPFSSEQWTSVADVVSRAMANMGDLETAKRWVGMALAKSRGRDRLQAHIVAAGAAWDAGDEDSMRRHLNASEAARTDPALGWRWHNARALCALYAGNGREAANHLQRALAASRRALFAFQAGRLWNELGLARTRMGELAAAERAFLHASRLLARCDAVSGRTVAQLNLAEVRVRRGRGWGVREALEHAERADRIAMNRRGSVQNGALAARFALMQGRIQVALELANSAIEQLGGGGAGPCRSELEVLAARALGWLDREDESREKLRGVREVAERFLEPEEVPALFALAGERAEARDRIGEDAFAALWRALLSGKPAPPAAWKTIEDVDAYRVARWIYDAERISPGWVDANRLEQASRTFLRMGARSFADGLDRGSANPWRAIERFLAAPSADFERLFSEAGRPEARLVWTGADSLAVLRDGSGGSSQLAIPCAGGSLELFAPAANEMLRGLLLVAAQRVEETLIQHGSDGASETTTDSGAIVGRSPCLREAVARADRLAARSMPILILGETGTGKELLARRIHARSRRSAGPFIAVNCAALAPTLLQSELFGFVRGAFSGAVEDRIGRFEAARGGTIFLDEIGDLPLDAQRVLLRVLQEGEICRLGDPVPRAVDVRVLAATHRDLRAMVEEGTFRRDLYYRLHVGRVELPSLAERGDDVILLAQAVLREVEDRPGLRLSAGARQKLKRHPWPGNVRELRNVLLQAAALGEGALIQAEDLELNSPRALSVSNYHQQVDGFRRRLIEAALEDSGGSIAGAARSLGITRQALSYLVRKLEL